MKGDHLIIALIKKINRAFAIEKEDIEEAKKELENVFHVMEQFGNRHKGIFKPMARFNVFRNPKEWLRFFPTIEEAKAASESACYYAVRSTNGYFRKEWKKVCEKIVDRELTHCLKRELLCFKEIYDFFLECGDYYEKKFNQALHLKTCLNLETHPIRVQKEFAMALSNTEGGPNCERSRDESKRFKKKDEKGHPALFIDCRELRDLFAD